MVKKDELLVFSTAHVAMDTYKRKYNEATTKKKQRFNDLNTNYKPGSPMFVQERDKIVPEYEKEIEDAKYHCLKEFNDILDETIAKERGSVTVTGGSVNNVLETLKCLETIPVSYDEYTALVDTLGGKLYWIDRYFEKIAEKNGIWETGVQPSYTKKLQILNQLKKDVTECINGYNGEDKTFIVTSSDRYIFKMEEEYTGNYAHVSMNSKEQAKRMISQALSKGDSMERACYLANLIQTSEPEMQNVLLTELADRDSTMLSDPTMNFTGVTNVLENFKKTEYEGMKKAQRIIEKIKGTDLKYDRDTIVYQNLGDRYFLKAIEQSEDNSLKELVKDVQEVKAAGEAKGNREAEAKKAGAGKGV